MVMRPRALDLFCGAGGAGMGLHRAGLLSAENRALYLSFWPGWEVVG